MSTVGTLHALPTDPRGHHLDPKKMAVCACAISLSFQLGSLWCCHHQNDSNATEAHLCHPTRAGVPNVPRVMLSSVLAPETKGLGPHLCHYVTNPSRHGCHSHATIPRPPVLPPALLPTEPTLPPGPPAPVGTAAAASPKAPVTLGLGASRGV